MKKMPKSICKHIRKEKARIRREVFGLKKQEEKIEELRQRFFKRPAKETTNTEKKTG